MSDQNEPQDCEQPNPNNSGNTSIPVPDPNNIIRPEKNMPTEKSSKGQMSVDSFPQPSQKRIRSLGSFTSVNKQTSPIDEVTRQNAKSDANISEAPDGVIKSEENIGETYVSSGKINVDLESTDKRDSKGDDNIPVPTDRDKKDSSEVGDTKPKTKLEEQLFVPQNRTIKLEEGEFELPRKTKVENTVSIDFQRQTKETTAEINTKPSQKEEVETDIFGKRVGKDETTTRVDTPDSNEKDEEELETREAEIGLKDLDPTEVSTNFKPTTKGEEEVPTIVSTNFPKKDKEVDTSFNINYQQKEETTKSVDNPDKSPKGESNVETPKPKYSIKKEESFDVTTSQSPKVDEGQQPRSSSDQYSLKDGTEVDTSYDINYQEKGREEVDTSHDINFQEKDQLEVDRIDESSAYDIKDGTEVDDTESKTVYTVKKDENIEPDNIDYNKKRVNESEIRTEENFNFVEKQGNERELDVNKDFNFAEKLSNESEINVNKDFNFAEKLPNESEINVNKDFNFVEKQGNESEINVNKDFNFVEKQGNESEINVNKDFNFVEKQGNESEINVNKDFNFEHKLPNESEINVNRDFYYREKVENEKEVDVNKDFNFVEKQGNESEVDVNKDFKFEHKLPNESEINVNKDFDFQEKFPNEQEVETPGLNEARDFGGNYKPTPYEVDEQLFGVADSKSDTKNDLDLVAEKEFVDYGISINRSSTSRSNVLEEGYSDNEIKLSGVTGNLFDYNTYTDYQLLEQTTSYVNSVSANVQNVNRRTVYDGYQDESSRSIDSTSNSGYSVSSSSKVETYKKDEASGLGSTINSDITSLPSLAESNFDYSNIDSDEAEHKKDGVLDGNVDVSTNYTKEVDDGGSLSSIDEDSNITQISEVNPDYSSVDSLLVNRLGGIGVRYKDTLTSDEDDGETSSSSSFKVTTYRKDSTTLSSSIVDVDGENIKATVTGGSTFDYTDFGTNVAESKIDATRGDENSNVDVSTNYTKEVGDGDLNVIDATTDITQISETNSNYSSVDSTEAESKIDATRNDETSNIVMTNYTVETDESGNLNVIDADSNIAQISEVNSNYYSDTENNIIGSRDIFKDGEDDLAWDYSVNYSNFKEVDGSDQLLNSIDEGTRPSGQEFSKFTYDIDSTESESKLDGTTSENIVMTNYTQDIVETDGSEKNFSDMTLNVVDLDDDTDEYTDYVIGQRSGLNPTYNLISYGRRSTTSSITTGDPENEGETETYQPINVRGLKNITSSSVVNTVNDVSGDSSTYSGEYLPIYGEVEVDGGVEEQIVGHFYSNQETSRFSYNINAYSNRTSPSADIITNPDDPETSEDETENYQPLANRRGFKNTYTTSGGIVTVNDVSGDSSTYGGEFKTRYDVDGNIIGNFYHNQESSNFAYGPNLNTILAAVGAGSRAIKNDDLYSTSYNSSNSWWNSDLDFGTFNTDLQVDVPTDLDGYIEWNFDPDRVKEGDWYWPFSTELSVGGDIGPAFTSDRYGSPEYQMPNINSSVTPNPDESLYPDGNTGLSATRFIESSDDSDLYDQILNNALRASGFAGAVNAVSEISSNVNEILSGGFNDFSNGVDLNDDFTNIIRRTVTTEIPSILFSYKRDFDISGSGGGAVGNFLESAFDALGIAGDAAETAGSAMNQPGAFLANAIRGQSGMLDIFTGGSSSDINVLSQGSDGKHGGIGGLFGGFGDSNRSKDYDINDSWAVGTNYWNVTSSSDVLSRLGFGSDEENILFNKDLIRSKIDYEDVSVSDMAKDLGISEGAVHRSLISSYEGIVEEIGPLPYMSDRIGISQDEYNPNAIRQDFANSKPFGFFDSWYQNDTTVSRSGRLVRQARKDNEGGDNTFKVNINGSDITVESSLPFRDDVDIDYIIGPTEIGNGVNFNSVYGFENDDESKVKLNRISTLGYYTTSLDGFYKNLFINSSVDQNIEYDNLDPHLIMEGRPPSLSFSGSENLTGKDIFYENYNDNITVSFSSFGSDGDEKSLIYNTKERIEELRNADEGDPNLESITSVEYHPDTFYGDNDERSFYLDNVFLSSEQDDFVPFQKYNIKTNAPIGREEEFTDPHLMGYNYPTDSNERDIQPGSNYGMRGQFYKSITEANNQGSDEYNHIVFANDLDLNEINTRINDNNLDRRNFVATIYDNNIDNTYNTFIDNNWLSSRNDRSRSMLLDDDNAVLGTSERNYIDPHLIEYSYTNNEGDRNSYSTIDYGPKGEFRQLLNDKDVLFQAFVTGGDNEITLITNLTENEDYDKTSHTRVDEGLFDMWSNNIKGISAEDAGGRFDGDNMPNKHGFEDPHFFEYNRPQDRNSNSRINYGPKGNFLKIIKDDNNNINYINTFTDDNDNNMTLYSNLNDSTHVSSNNFYTGFSQNSEHGGFINGGLYNISNGDDTENIDPHLIGYHKNYTIESSGDSPTNPINDGILRYSEIGARGRFLKTLGEGSSANINFTLFPSNVNGIKNIFDTKENENFNNMINVLSTESEDNQPSVENISHFIPKWVSGESGDGILWSWRSRKSGDIGLDEDLLPSIGGPKYLTIHTSGTGGVPEPEGNVGVGIRLENNDLDASGLFNTGGKYTHTFRDVPVIENPNDLTDYDGGDQLTKHVHVNYIVAPNEYKTVLTEDDEGFDTSDITYTNENGNFIWDGVNDDIERRLVSTSGMADYNGNGHEETLRPIPSAIGLISDELKSTLEVSSNPENRAKKRPYAISKWHNTTKDGEGEGDGDYTIIGDSAQRAAGFGTRTSSVNSFRPDLQARVHGEEYRTSRESMLVNINQYKYLETHRTVDGDLVNSDARDKGEGFIAALKNARDSFSSESDNVVFDIPFQFHADISGETRAADWATESAIGRTAEFFIWSKTGTRTIQLKTTYVIMYDGESTVSPDLAWGEYWTEERVMEVIRKYRMLVLPLSRTGEDNPISPPSIVIVGNKYLQSASHMGMTGNDNRNNIDFSRWVTQDVNIDPKYEMGHTNTRTPFAYEISMTLKEVFSWSDYQSFDSTFEKYPTV